MTTANRNGQAFLDGWHAPVATLLPDARPAVAPAEHWTFEVDTPFRPATELMERSPASGASGADTFVDPEIEVSEGAEAEAFDGLETLEGAIPAEFEVGEDQDERELGSLQKFGAGSGQGAFGTELDELFAPVAESPPAPVYSHLASSPAPFAGPKVQLEHWHLVSACDPKTGTCTPAKVLTKMTPSAMNPGFINAATGKVVVGSDAASLQARLTALITSKYARYLTGAARKAGAATSGDRIRVALVDLSGNKLANPELAGWGMTVPMQGASTTKVVILYALHQLLLDAFREATNGRHTAPAALIGALEATWRAAGLTTMPAVSELIEITANAPDPVTVKLSAKAQSKVVSAFKENDNSVASWMMLRLTFPYIASVLWASGLHDDLRGGLWLSSSFGCDAALARTTNPTEHVLVDCTRAGKTLKGRFVWRHDPRAGSTTNRQNATALSLVTMFTLLAQGRLGGPGRSSEIVTTLRDACSRFWGPLSSKSLTGAGLPPTKCGVATIGGASFNNDVILVERGTKRYVATALTRDAPPDDLLEKLLVDLDTLI